jgi:hypothetical protein
MQKRKIEIKSIACLCILLRPSPWSNFTKKDKFGISEYRISLEKVDVYSIPTEVCKMLW